MLWLVIVLAVCGAVGIRLLTLRGRPRVWWWSFTFSLLGIVVGSALLVDEAGVNEVLGVANVAYLLSNLSFVAAGGASTIYVHTLSRERPSATVMALHATAAALVGTVITVGWLLAPIHETSYPRFRQVPPNPQALAYDGIFHLYFMLVLANAAVCNFRLARRTGHNDPARWIGLLLIGGGSALDIAAHLLYLARLALQPQIGAPALKAATVADGITLVAVLGIAAGAVAILAVPSLLALLRAWYLTNRLRPLWLRTREMHPAVALPRPRLVRHSPALQAERMITEIIDGLRLLAVPDGTGVADPYDAVVEALRCSPARGGRTASSRLPTPASRLEEEEQVLDLARRYVADPAHAS